MSERGRGDAAQQPTEPDLGSRRLHQVLAPDDQVDALTQVIDDHAEAICPVAVSVADGQVALGRDLSLPIPGEQVGPGFGTSPQCDPEHWPLEAALPARARAARPRPRPAVLGGPL